MDRDNPQPWSVGELAKLRSMFEAKCSDDEIAAELGAHRSARAVAVKRHNLGLTHYRRATRPAGDAMGWVARARHLEDALELALALADCRAPPGEIAETIREQLAKAPRP